MMRRNPFSMFHLTSRQHGFLVSVHVVSILRIIDQKYIYYI